MKSAFIVVVRDHFGNITNVFVKPSYGAAVNVIQDMVAEAAADAKDKDIKFTSTMGPVDSEKNRLGIEKYIAKFEVGFARYSAVVVEDVNFEDDEEHEVILGQESDSAMVTAMSDAAADDFRFEVPIKKDRRGKVTESIQLHADPAIRAARGKELFPSVYGTVVEADYATNKATFWKVGLPDSKTTVDYVIK